MACQSRLDDIRDFVITRLSDLPTLLRSDAVTARVQLMKHVHSITLHPEGRTYKACGSWDFLGDERMVGAAGRS